MKLEIDKSKLRCERVKTTPQNVKEANEALFRSTMNLPQAAAHCGMTQKEMKLTFFEYLKYNQPEWDTCKTVPNKFQTGLSFDMIDETQGGF
jgi:hypothetical protein